MKRRSRPGRQAGSPARSRTRKRAMTGKMRTESRNLGSKKRTTRPGGVSLGGNEGLANTWSQLPFGDLSLALLDALNGAHRPWCDLDLMATTIFEAVVGDWTQDYGKITPACPLAHRKKSGGQFDFRRAYYCRV